jgi:hypothetical protein
LPIEKVNYMNSRLLGATAGIWVILVLICLLSAGADGRAAKGDGLSRVVIPRYIKAPGARPGAWLFLAVAGIVGLALVRASVARRLAMVFHVPGHRVVVDPLPMRPFPAMAILRERKSAPGPQRLMSAQRRCHTEVLAVFPNWRAVQPAFRRGHGIDLG